MSQINQNTAALQDLLDAVNSLPEASQGGSSNYEDVTTETNAYTAKIAQLENALSALESELAGKVAGGSGGETQNDLCTVITNSNCSYQVIYSTLEEGRMKITHTSDTSNGKTISNVLCGQYIYVPVVSTIPGYSIVGNAEHAGTLSAYSQSRTIVFLITASAGETVEIRVWDDD